MQGSSSQATPTAGLHEWLVCSWCLTGVCKGHTPQLNGTPRLHGSLAPSSSADKQATVLCRAVL
jgi:hypothetical protein